MTLEVGDVAGGDLHAADDLVGELRFPGADGGAVGLLSHEGGGLFAHPVEKLCPGIRQHFPAQGEDDALGLPLHEVRLFLGPTADGVGFGENGIRQGVGKGRRNRGELRRVFSHGGRFFRFVQSALDAFQAVGEDLRGYLPSEEEENGGEDQKIDDCVQKFHLFIIIVCSHYLRKETLRVSGMDAPARGGRHEGHHLMAD